MRIQIAITQTSLNFLDEMCDANGAMSRSHMVEVAIRKLFFADEITQQMRAMRRVPKRGRDGSSR